MNGGAVLRETTVFWDLKMGGHIGGGGGGERRGAIGRYWGGGGSTVSYIYSTFCQIWFEIIPTLQGQYSGTMAPKLVLQTG